MAELRSPPPASVAGHSIARRMLAALRRGIPGHDALALGHDRSSCDYLGAPSHSGQAAWLTMVVQAGFVCGTLISACLNLSDVLNARWLFALGCVTGSLANAAVTRAEGSTAIIVLRLATGVALAWLYPPGMKVAASCFERRRGAALGILVGALTAGSAFPHLLASLAVNVPWRTLMLTASACALAAGLLILAVVRSGPHLSATAPFDPGTIGRVFTNRGVRLATLGEG